MKLSATLAVVVLLTAFTDVSTIFKTKYKQITCSNNNNQLLNLFTVMCTNIANGTNNTLRDACIGCFQRASNENGQPSVASIVTCATMYLLNTNYSTCFNLPNTPPAVVTTTTVAPTTTTTRPPTTATTARPTNATTITPPTTRPPITNATMMPPPPPMTTPPGIDPRLKRSININVNCDNGYCGYVRCIRSVNANILIAGCYAEARVSNNATYANQRVILYKNITSCILAKSRCSGMNPITGQTQNGRYTTQTIGKFGGTTSTMYYYALQISSSGELRIIGLPGSVSIQQDFCSSQTNLMESTWSNFVC